MPQVRYVPCITKLLELKSDGDNNIHIVNSWSEQSKEPYISDPGTRSGFHDVLEVVQGSRRPSSGRRVPCGS